METKGQRIQMYLTPQHGSYLQGMETSLLISVAFFECCTDPTYKEWKRNNGKLFVANGLARILPTRNGNEVTMGLKNDRWISTDPTYKEWKLQKRMEQNKY